LLATSQTAEAEGNCLILNESGTKRIRQPRNLSDEVRARSISIEKLQLLTVEFKKKVY
jgi:hypothetical protein